MLSVLSDRNFHSFSTQSNDFHHSEKNRERLQNLNNVYILAMCFWDTIISVTNFFFYSFSFFFFTLLWVVTFGLLGGYLQAKSKGNLQVSYKPAYTGSMVLDILVERDISWTQCSLWSCKLSSKITMTIGKNQKKNKKKTIL